VLALTGVHAPEWVQALARSVSGWARVGLPDVGDT
jgi:hypothetical protein